MSHTPKVDASEALARLGITHPVRFVNRNLQPNGMDYELADYFFGGTTQAEVNNQDPSEVFVDWGALDYANSVGDYENGNAPQIIAHELIHVKQFQDIGSIEEANRRYRAQRDAGTPYRDITFEAEAFAKAPDYAPFVKVTR